MDKNIIEIKDTVYGNIFAHKTDTYQTYALINKKEAHDHHEIVWMNELIEKIKTKEKNLVLDIGANFGIFTRYWAENNNDIIVHGFEPQPILFEIIKLNTQKFHNVKVFDTVIGKNDSICEIPIFDENCLTSYGSVCMDPELANNEKICAQGPHGKLSDSIIVNKLQTKSTSLDSLYSENTNICFIKLDVEGMEKSILENGISTISNNRPVMVVEHFPGIYPIEGKWFEDWFTKYDYDFARVHINYIAIPKELETIKIKK